MYRRLLALTTALVISFSGAGIAHEYWVDVVDASPESTATVEAHLRVGSDFKGDSLPYVPAFSTGFEVIDREGGWVPELRAGNRPAISFVPRHAGLNVISYETSKSRLDYSDPQILPTYLAWEGLDWVMARHTARGYDLTGFSERYSRYAKALVDVGGTGEGLDVEVGMITELIALQNPYRLAPGELLTVKVLWQGQVEADRQVKIFARTGEEVTVTDLRSDAAGEVSFAVQANTAYMLNSVHMEEIEPDNGVIWESYWASLTFTTP